MDNTKFVISLTLFFLAVVTFSGAAAAGVHNDRTGATYSTIQEAIDAADDNDTLIADPGTYTENIHIDRENLTLTANGTVTINATNTNQPTINITKNGATINGFTITNGYSGINIQAQNSKIQNNTITDNGAGIYFYESSNNTITGNTITQNNWDGIFLYSSLDNNIMGNIIKENGVGRVTGSMGNLVYDNYFINNTNQIEGDLSGNNWNTTEAGNYWSDYTGDDTNTDGIGDIPYQQDQKPLIVDLMIENLTVTTNSIQIKVKNNGKADLTKINPTGQFQVDMICDGQEYQQFIGPLVAGGSTTITQNINTPNKHHNKHTIQHNKLPQQYKHKRRQHKQQPNKH